MITTSDCSSAALAGILYTTQGIIQLIQMIAPILLLVMASIHLIQLMKNPDDKKGLPKIRNSFIAAAPVSCCKSSGFKAQSFKNVKVWAMRGSGAGSGYSSDDTYASCMQSSVNAIKPYAKEWKYVILPNATHGDAGGNALTNKEMLKFIFSE